MTVKHLLLSERPHGYFERITTRVEEGDSRSLSGEHCPE